VDSYVVENSRHALQVHASLYRDLLTLLQREALLALTVRALAIVCNEPHPWAVQTAPHAAPGCHCVPQEISGLTYAATRLDRRRSLDFQRDLQLYEELLARAAAKGARENPLKQRTIPSSTVAPFCWTRPSWKRAPGREPGTNGIGGPRRTSMRSREV